MHDHHTVHHHLNLGWCRSWTGEQSCHLVSSSAWALHACCTTSQPLPSWMNAPRASRSATLPVNVCISACLAGCCGGAGALNPDHQRLKLTMPLHACCGSSDTYWDLYARPTAAHLSLFEAERACICPQESCLSARLSAALTDIMCWPCPDAVLPVDCSASPCRWCWRLGPSGFLQLTC